MPDEEIPQAGQRVRFSTERGARTGVVQRVWGSRTVNVTIRTDDKIPGQTFVRLHREVEIIPGDAAPSSGDQ